MSKTNNRRDMKNQLRMKGLNPSITTTTKDLQERLAEVKKDKLRNVPGIASRTIFKDSVVRDYASAIGLGDDIQIMTKTNQGEKMRRFFNIKIKDDSTELCDGLQQYLVESVKRTDKQKWWESVDLENDISYDYAYILKEGLIGGLIVAQRGECVVDVDGQIIPGGDWNVWTVRLICNAEKFSTFRGGAGIALGLFVYAIKKARIERGMLEVADNYENYRAYCLYTRFNFEESQYPCYGFGWELVMEVRPARVKYRDIFEAVTNWRNYAPPTVSALYCNELKRAIASGETPTPFEEFKEANDLIVSVFEDGGTDDELSGTNCVIM
jgi:hypothetical protein